jgi:hypothetical protein
MSCESEMLALTVTENISCESEIAGKIEARVRKHTKKISKYVSARLNLTTIIQNI